MVWSAIDKDGKPRYIVGKKPFFRLSKVRNKNAQDGIPEGYKVARRLNGKLSLVRG